jgi:hypothetical protein
LHCAWRIRRLGLYVEPNGGISREIVQAQPREAERQSSHLEYRSIRNKLTDLRFVLPRRVQTHRRWNIIRNGHVKVLRLHLSEMVLQGEH